MKTSITCCLMAFCFCSLAAGTEVDGEAALKAQLPEIFAKAAAHYKALDAAATASLPLLWMLVMFFSALKLLITAKPESTSLSMPV